MKSIGLHQMWSNCMSTARPFWFFVYYAFNRVDTERRNEFGADRTCAEWILRNGGAISRCQQPRKLITDYNSLPPATPNGRPFRVHTIVADNLGLLALGFDHLQGCGCVERIVLRNCAYLEDDALRRLCHVRSSLKELEVFGCRLVRDDGLLSLSDLERLRSVRLGRLSGVKHMEHVVRQLQLDRPDCVVEATEC